MHWTRAPGYKVAADVPANEFDDAQPQDDAQDKDYASTIARNHDVRVKRLSISKEVHHKQSCTRLVRRLLGLAAAVWFVQISVSACVGIRDVLVGLNQASMDMVLYESLLMLPYMGTRTIRQSPLVTQVLQADTTPRNYSIYLQSESETSTVDCGAPLPVPEMWTNEFHRQFFARIMLDTVYNLTFLQNYELVVPVIDCSFSGIVFGDPTVSRLFYIMRGIADPTDVRLLTLIMQTAYYELTDRSGAVGSTLLTTATFLEDLSATQVQHYFLHAIGYPFLELSFQVYEFLDTTPDSYWASASIPTSSTELSRQVKSSCRQGTFVDNEHDRSNTENTIWMLHQDPLQVISKLQYIGRATLRNSWAWVHLIHLLLAIEMVLNIMLLGMITTNHAHQFGDLWLGDAFVVLNSRLWMLLLIVLISWSLEGFWSLVELCIHDGNTITEMQGVFIYESIMRADMMILCFGLADVMGRVARERIEPALALVVYYVIFEKRLSILQWNAVLLDIVTSFTNADYDLGIMDDPAVSLITPMRLWSVHELEPVPVKVMLAMLTPIFGSFIVCISAYVLMRKTLRCMLHRFHREGTVPSPNGTQAHTLTLFEEATGTKLFGRSGFVSHYENTMVAQGMVFATADGIYSTGFVIANDKFLVQTASLWEIWVMKITNIRFTDVYVYEVKADEAQQRSRLVYPSTLTIRDLIKLNIHKLM